MKILYTKNVLILTLRIASQLTNASLSLIKLSFGFQMDGWMDDSLGREQGNEVNGTCGQDRLPSKGATIRYPGGGG